MRIEEYPQFWKQKRGENKNTYNKNNNLSWSFPVPFRSFEGWKRFFPPPTWGSSFVSADDFRERTRFCTQVAPTTTRASFVYIGNCAGLASVARLGECQQTCFRRCQWRGDGALGNFFTVVSLRFRYRLFLVVLYTFISLKFTWLPVQMRLMEHV